MEAAAQASLVATVKEHTVLDGTEGLVRENVSGVVRHRISQIGIEGTWGRVGPQTHRFSSGTD